MEFQAHLRITSTHRPGFMPTVAKRGGEKLAQRCPVFFLPSARRSAGAGQGHVRTRWMYHTCIMQPCDPPPGCRGSRLLLVRRTIPRIRGEDMVTGCRLRLHMCSWLGVTGNIARTTPALRLPPKGPQKHWITKVCDCGMSKFEVSRGMPYVELRTSANVYMHTYNIYYRSRSLEPKGYWPPSGRISDESARAIRGFRGGGIECAREIVFFWEPGLASPRGRSLDKSRVGEWCK